MLALYNASGSRLAENDDFDSGTASRLVWTAPSSGTYYIEVSGYDGATGTYALSLNGASGPVAVPTPWPAATRAPTPTATPVRPAPTRAPTPTATPVRPAGTPAPRLTTAPAPTQAPFAGDDYSDDISGGAVGTIVVGQSLEGNIERLHDRDFFSFRAERGREYRIETHLRSIADTFLALYNVSGSRLAENDDFGNSYASLLVWTAPSSGTYYIEVSGYGGATGTYVLSLNETSGPAATPAPTSRPTPTASAATSLEEYAAEFAGGPGAIYVGDVTQLVGPAPSVDLGNLDGNVPLESLQRHLWIYESPFYAEPLERAKLLDPTPMVYDGEPIRIRHTCINRALLPCVLLETYFAPNLLERTNGKVEFSTSSYPELGLRVTDTLSLVADGTLESATMYVTGEIPAIEIQNLWGIYSSREQEFQATQAFIKDIDELVLSETGGVIMNHNWFGGNDQYLFCRERIDTLDGFEGKRIRSVGTSLSDWINGMGAAAQFVSFAEVYTNIERGILNCGVARADLGFGQRWHEVTDYIIGPLFDFPSYNNVINAEKWASIPQDLQQIIIEEAAKSELEALRIAAIQNETGLQKNIDAGMEFVPFSDEVNSHSLQAAMEHVVPGWVDRVGNTSHPIIADTFNNKLGPIVGLRIEPDGTVVKLE